jgi:membrane protein DedA with SNARE-associated domain
MAESAGVPLPGETILVTSGILAQQSKLDLGDDVILFDTLGAVVGDQIGYWVGRKGGGPCVLRWGRHVKITPGRLAGAERFFARRGGKVVFFGRFFSGHRVFGALVAGVSRRHWGTFVFYNALGGAVWATAAILVGYLLGGSLGVAEQWLGKAMLLVGITAALAVVLYLLYRWVANHPEQIRNSFDRLGGGRIQRFLASSAGLWLKRRLSPRGAYGLALTAGLVLTGLFPWALGAVVQDVVARDPLVRVDARILEFFHARCEPALTGVVGAFEFVFSAWVLLSAGVAPGCALVFLAYRREDPSWAFSGFVLLAAALGKGALCELFGILFQRPRPPASPSLVNEGGSGFPSAHAMTIVAVGAAVWYLCQGRPHARRLDHEVRDPQALRLPPRGEGMNGLPKPLERPPPGVRPEGVEAPAAVRRKRQSVDCTSEHRGGRSR